MLGSEQIWKTMKGNGKEFSFSFSIFMFQSTKEDNYFRYKEESCFD